MYRTTTQPTASRLAAAFVTTALLMSLCSPFAALAAADSGPGTDHSKNVTTGEVAQALGHTSGILQSSASITSASDGDSALQTDDGSVNIPKDASNGVTLNSGDGPALDIALPGADQAGDGQQVAPGVVAYSSNNGSANAVQAEDDGSVRMLTVIDNKTAPRTYDYKITVPDGGRIELTSDGGAAVLDVDNQVLSHVNAPWATDAKGKQIKTWFTTDGDTLTQHVKHNVRGVAYPVMADPHFDWHWYGVSMYINQTEANKLSAIVTGGGGAATIATLLTGGTGAVAIGLGVGIATMGSGAVQWCSANGHGAWIHYNWFANVVWCNRG
ncbi:MAG TPA: hypothetical protein VLI54_03735 [Bacillota bacterium]|nr:hypothetical protein [Bacillota bacterium]